MSLRGARPDANSGSRDGDVLGRLGDGVSLAASRHRTGCNRRGLLDIGRLYVGIARRGDPPSFPGALQVRQAHGNEGRRGGLPLRHEW
jgi:hypothetical protein